MSQPRPNFPTPAPTAASPPAAVAVADLLRPRPPGLSTPPDARSLFEALMRRAKLAFGAGLLLAAVIGAATWYFVPRAKYTAVATLHVATNPKRIMFEPKDYRTDYRTYQRTQLALLKDRKVLSHAVNQPEVTSLPTIKLQADPEEWIESELKAEFPGGSEVLVVSLSGDRPVDTAKIVNAVVKSYMTLIVNEEHRERLSRLDMLKKLWDKYQADLLVKRKSLKELTATVGTVDRQTLAITQQFKAEHLSLARKEKMRAHSEMLRAQAELSAALGGPSSGDDEAGPGVSEPAVREALERHPEVMALRAKAEDAERRFNTARRLSRNPSDPSVARPRSLLAAAQQNLKAARQRLYPVVEEQLGPKSRGGASAVSQVRAQVNVWRSYGEALDREIEQLQAETRVINEGSLDLENEREEIAISGDIARKVGSEVEAVQVELEAPERIRVLSTAKVPRKKDELRKIRAGGLAAAGAFVCVLLSVSLWEFQARRVCSAEEVATGLGLRVVGALPAYPKGNRLRSPGSSGPDGGRWRSQLVESVDATRTMLLHASRAESVRVILITSAVQGEGKTSLSCHLAASLARAGRKTLLVDCDLRRPSAHRLLDQPEGPGLCEVLRGEVPADAAVQATVAAGLHFLPAGRCDATVLMALARDDLRALLSQLRAEYDFIIVDSAPVLPVADSLLMAQGVDAVLMSVLRHTSRLPAVSVAYERLTSLGVNVLGAVVNGVQVGRYGSDFYASSRPAE